MIEFVQSCKTVVDMPKIRCEMCCLNCIRHHVIVDDVSLSVVLGRFFSFLDPEVIFIV